MTTDVMDPAALSIWSKDNSCEGELTPEQELEKLREEKKALQMRVLGVNELARLLQDRTSELRIMEEKNKRLEVAVVRLENRCSNFEKKIKAQSGTVPRPGGAAPVIPGPSRHIVDSLMRENAELKKVINKQASKGPTSYLEAVKTFQLEELVEQQRQDIEFYRSQFNSLGLSEGGEDEKAISMPAGESPSTVRSLKLKVAKLQQTMRVKDKFCSLLSERVALLERQLREQMSPQPSSLSPQPPSLQLEPLSMPSKSREEVNLASSTPGVDAGTQVGREEKSDLDLEGLRHKLEDEAKSLQEKLSSREAELREREDTIKKLQLANDDLTYYNKTLVEEKNRDTTGRLSPAAEHDVERLKKEVDEGRHLCEEYRKKAEQLEKENHDLVEQVDHNELQRGINESKLSTLENEHRQKMQLMKDQMEDLQENLDVQKSLHQEKCSEYRTLDVEYKKLHQQIKALQLGTSSIRSLTLATGGLTTPAYSTERLDHITVSDSSKRCHPSSVDPTIRPVLVARTLEDPQPPSRPQTGLHPRVTNSSLHSAQQQQQFLHQQQQQHPQAPPIYSHRANTHLGAPVPSYPPPGVGYYPQVPPTPTITATTSSFAHPTHGPALPRFPTRGYSVPFASSLPGYTASPTGSLPPSLPQQYSRSHPPVNPTTLQQQQQYAGYDPTSSFGSMASSGYFSGMSFPSEGQQGQGMGSSVGGGAQQGSPREEQQQQQQQGGSYHGYGSGPQ